MFEFFRRSPPERKSGTPMIALSLQCQPRWAPRDIAGLARIGVMGNTVANR